MRATLRRGSRETVDEALEIARTSPVAIALLHVLPSLPFLYTFLRLGVDLDHRGALPPGATGGVVVALLPKLLGWGALAAWAAARHREQPISTGTAWRHAAARLPEVVLMASLVLLLVAAAPFTLGFTVVAAAAAALGLAAAAAPAPVGGGAALRQIGAALKEDLGRGFGITLVLALGFAFAFLNCLLLPFLLLPLGAGGLGLDLSTWMAAFRPDRVPAWALAAAVATTLIEPLGVIACAGWHRDREAEREGARFAAFADELDDRAAARAHVVESAA